MVLDTPAGEALFHGGWGWYALVLAMGVFNTVLGEELLFRGYLLPRMQGVFGRADWLAKRRPVRALPPARAVGHAVRGDRRLPARLPSRRYRSAWFGIIVHSSQTLVVSLIVLTYVLVAGYRAARISSTSRVRALPDLVHRRIAEREPRRRPARLAGVEAGTRHEGHARGASPGRSSSVASTWSGSSSQRK
jgi:hypothetical protein